jgi:hypothetical protein
MTMNATSLQFGIYRDGLNNLDHVQASVIGQALATSKTDPTIAFNIEDTTARRGLEPEGIARTEFSDVRGGDVVVTHLERPHEMSSRGNLAAFVAATLDKAEANGAKQTWIDLVDHGGGDGGGLETNAGIMSMPDIAGAIGDGVRQHAQAHPDDAARHVDGVVANQCLMATLAFTRALSDAGVKFLAASPETMIAPGVSSSVAHAIAANENDPAAMGKAVVADTMKTTYGNDSLHWSPAAAFDVIDCDPSRVVTMEHAVRDLNGALIAASSDSTMQKAILQDANSVDGFTRHFPSPTPWIADRPAIALYQAFAADPTLSQAVRTSATDAVNAVTSLVVAHGESAKFAPFGGVDYRDAVGPSVHFPTNATEYDLWAPKISETNNAFFKAVDGSRLAHAIA